MLLRNLDTGQLLRASVASRVENDGTQQEQRPQPQQQPQPQKTKTTNKKQQQQQNKEHQQQREEEGGCGCSVIADLRATGSSGSSTGTLMRRCTSLDTASEVALRGVLLCRLEHYSRVTTSTARGITITIETSRHQ